MNKNELKKEKILSVEFFKNLDEEISNVLQLINYYVRKKDFNVATRNLVKIISYFADEIIKNNNSLSTFKLEIMIIYKLKLITEKILVDSNLTIENFLINTRNLNNPDLSKFFKLIEDTIIENESCNINLFSLFLINMSFYNLSLNLNYKDRYNIYVENQIRKEKLIEIEKK